MECYNTGFEQHFVWGVEGNDLSPTVPPLTGCSGGCFIVCASGCLPRRHQWSQHHLASLPGALRRAPGQGRDSSQLSKALRSASYVLFPGEGRGTERGQPAADQGTRSCFSQSSCWGTFPSEQPQRLAAPGRAVINGLPNHRVCLAYGWIY